MGAFRLPKVVPASMFLFTTTDAPTTAGGSVQSAIRNAATTTGTDFAYLLDTAQRESSLDPTAKAPNSSAKGLFQFLDSTWMQTVKEEGPSIGLKSYADDIQKTANGRYVANSAAEQQQILALRDDPNTSAMVAGAFTQRNRQSLSASLGREPTNGELYIAHFMGADGAASLIGAAASTPDVNAAAMFPSQAAANQPVFYGKGGRARSVSEVYTNLVAGHNGVSASSPTTSVPATSAAGTEDGVSGSSGIWLGIPTPKSAASSSALPFQSLFRTDNSAPVSNYVAATWSGLATSRLAASSSTPQAVQSPALMAGSSAVPLPPVRPTENQGDDSSGDFFASLGSFFSGMFGGISAAPPREGKNWS